MRLSGLVLRHFRNLGSQDLEFPPEGVALIGDNAQGKSNFLEAIYYLETFRSFRGARDEQLVGFGQEVFRVAGIASSSSPDHRRVAEVTAAFERMAGRKKVSVDGTEPERLGEALGRLAAVVFSPTDVDLVSGGPKERRRFLDMVLSLNEPGYLSALQEYKKILSRRNASLKEGYSGSVVMAWNQGLISSGSKVMWARKNWIEGGTQTFGDYYVRVSENARARMTYRPSVPSAGANSVDEIGEAIRGALADSSDRERRMGTTLVGPHRDEVRLHLERADDDLDLRDYGSGGQRRTAAWALRLVEAWTIRKRRNETPLILLDDVFAELDQGRSERVLELMEEEEPGQVVLTAPKEADVKIKKDKLALWRISAGRITT
ncbi:MAG: DNA replication and repair protein RecF, partial [Gemmatimonadetes bacterium]|nr:DNA replication and repair protein RecF [Gemmatimonadota bacterium]